MRIVHEGYRSFNGHIFTKEESDIYNKLIDRIEAFEDAGMNCDHLLDERNRVFKLIVNHQYF